MQEPVMRKSIRNSGRTQASQFTHLVVFASMLFALSGCANLLYKQTATGKLTGKLYVEWISPNLFVYPT